jgi:hypothetical protein
MPDRLDRRDVVPGCGLARRMQATPLTESNELLQSGAPIRLLSPKRRSVLSTDQRRLWIAFEVRSGVRDGFAYRTALVYYLAIRDPLPLRYGGIW